MSEFSHYKIIKKNLNMKKIKISILKIKFKSFTLWERSSKCKNRENIITCLILADTFPKLTSINK